VDDIVKQIHSVLKKVENEYSNINCGGCGVIASILGEYLAAKTEVRVAIGAREYLIEKQEFSFDEIKEELSVNDNPSINDWETYGVSFNHVWIEFLWEGEWYSMDTEGMEQGTHKFHSTWNTYKERMSVEAITQLSNNITGWNTWFSREQIPNIKQDIENGLEAVLC